MNLDILKGKWNQIMGEVRTTFGELTDNDVEQIKGEREKFIGVVQEKYGILKEDAEKQVDAFLKKYPE